MDIKAHLPVKKVLNYLLGRREISPITEADNYANMASRLQMDCTQMSALSGVEATYGYDIKYGWWVEVKEFSVKGFNKDKISIIISISDSYPEVSPVKIFLPSHIETIRGTPVTELLTCTYEADFTGWVCCSLPAGFIYWRPGDDLCRFLGIINTIFQVILELTEQENSDEENSSEV